MGIATGRPRGRPKGAKNKRTVEREADMREMAARIGNAVGGAFEATPWHTSHQSIKTRRSPKTCEWMQRRQQFAMSGWPLHLLNRRRRLTSFHWLNA
jgi:hypothetical protein